MHKAQGISLDVANIEGSHINFAPGQAFVAVSRCRRKSGLHIANAHLMRVFASAAVHQYYEEAVRVDPAVLSSVEIRESAVNTPSHGEEEDREPASPPVGSTRRAGASAPKPEDMATQFQNGQHGEEYASLWPILVGWGIGLVFAGILLIMALL